MMYEHAIVIVLVVQFFHACTWEKMVFGFVRKALEDLPWYLKKPLFDCPICMTPWWGPVVICFGILGFGWPISNITQVFMTLAVAAGINTMIYMIMKDRKEEDCNCN